MNDIGGSSIIVTGAGRGLGRAISQGLAHMGARVIVAGRTEADIVATANEIRAKGGEAHSFKFDASDPVQCADLVAFAISKNGSLNSMVVNHGVTLHKAAAEVSADEFRAVVETNLTSAFICAQAAGRKMIEGRSGGTIVLISSNASIVAYDGLVAYSASKAGVDQLCKQLALEWAPFGIRVNAIGPGYMNSHMRGTEGEYEDPAFKAQLMTKIPARRRGDPDELVGPVAFFASPASSYVTGQYLAVDGGYCII